MGYAGALAALEARRTLLEECAHAFLIVTALEALRNHRRDLLRVALCALLEPLANGGLGGRHRERRVGGHLRSVVAHRRFEVGLLDQQVQQAHVVRFLGAERSLRHQDGASVGGADDVAQRYYAVERVGESEPRRRNSEARALGSDPYVT